MQSSKRGILLALVPLMSCVWVTRTCARAFVVAVTAYLTGLWTNTMFFGAKTLLKFTAIVVPPLTVIEIASMMMQFKPTLAVQVIYGSSIFLLATAGVIFSRLPNKWRDTTFSYVSTGV